ncbi:MAG: hypothetical protein OSJ66_03985 [Clostridia bacterium]|nr:hypothetical protein [Clostridia bacterium]
MKANKEKILIAIILLIQTIIFIIAGISKSYIHMDEAFSMGLTNYPEINIRNNEDFYNKWHDKDYYKDYLVINEDEKNDFLPVYENQKNDVHPPLYYLLLRIAMGFHIDEFSKWSGIIINIIIYIFITLFMYLIIQKLLEGKTRYKEKSAILASISSLTIASINNAMYIRMYALSTLNIAITTYLHLKLLDSKESNKKLLVAIGISALAGSLTHYYYLFYLAMLFIMFTVKYLKEEQYKEFGKYFLTMVISGIISIIIFPFSIKHMFFGYRGQGAMSSLLNISESIKSIGIYLWNLNLYAFNNILFLIIIAMLIICIYKKRKNIKLIEQKNKYINYLLFPSLLYFILVALSSPWKELRYIMPICGIVFIIVMFYLEELFCNFIKEKKLIITFVSIFIIMFAMPSVSNFVYNNIFKQHHSIKVEVLYKDKKEIVSKLKNELNLPTIYFAHSKGFRFLDDILLFANLDNSYIYYGVKFNEEDIREVFKNQNTQNGIIVFINEKEENKKLLEIVKNSLNLEEITYLQRMNACDIYYIK